MKTILRILIIHSLFFNVIYAEVDVLSKAKRESEVIKQKEKVNAVHEFDALVAAKRVAYVKFRNKADRSIHQNKPFTALLALQEAELIFTKDAHLHYLKGFVFAQLHLYAKARKSYMTSLGYNEKHINSLLNLVELNYYLKDYKKAIYWYGKTTDVIGKNTSPLLEFKYFISVTKLSNENKVYKKLREKIVNKYAELDDNPYYYYALAVENFEKGNKAEFFNLIYSATYIFKNVTLIKNWNKALEDSAYLLPSDIILRPKVKESEDKFVK